MPTLELIYGPMFAGKSCELIRRIRLLKVLNKQYLVIKPLIDTRYDSESIVSHNMDQEKCIKLESMKTIDSIKLDLIDTVFIDEGQFFDDLKEYVIKLVEVYNKNVIVAGLITDFNRNKFGQILDLIPFSDKITQLNALCLYCMDGTPGIFSHRKQNINTDQIQIGENDLYVSVCRKHFLGI
jgi:thymidine kinase